MVKVTVGKKGITTGSVSISVRDFGAVGDGTTDDSAAFQATFDSLPATGGEVRIPGKGTYKLNAEVFITKPNVQVSMDHSATINIINILGTGTPDVHSQVNVLSAFKVTAADCSFTGGRITGQVSSDGKNLCGILVAGVNNFTASYMTLDSMYNSIWAGGGVENLKLAYLNLEGHSHNLLVGYQDSQVSTTAPQVNKAVFLGITSTGSTNDGMKLTAFANQVQIIGGQYHTNGKDGIDCFVSGEFLSISGVHCIGNGTGPQGGLGIDAKFGEMTLTGVFGNNRMCMIHNCILRGNDDFGLSIATTTDIWPDMDVDGYSVIGNIAEGNTRQGFHLGMRRGCVIGNIARNNGSRGFHFLSAHDLVVIGNIADQNNQLSSTEGFVFQKQDQIQKGRRSIIMGNIAIGSGVASKQQIGFDMPDVNQEDLRYIGNSSINHNTQNYNLGFAFSSDMRMRDNRGVETENSGISSAISTGGTIAHGLDTRGTLDFVSIIPITSASNFINFGRITEAVTETENYNRITEAVTLTENYGLITDGSGATDVSVTADSTNLTVTFGGGGSHAFYWSAKHSVSH